MSLTSWLRNLHTAWHRRPKEGGSRRSGGSGPAARLRPRLEALEDRLLPSTLAVLNVNDSGPGSLRADIAAAHSGDTIVIDSSLRSQNITLTSGELVIDKDLDIEGPGGSALPGS